MFRKNSIWGIAALAVIAVLSTATSADASFRIRLTDSASATGVVVTDQNLAAGGDTSATVGLLNVSATLGGTTIVTGTGFQQPPLGGLGGDQVAGLDLLGGTVNAVGATTVVLSLQATGYSGGIDGLMAALNSVGGTASGAVSSVTFKGWVNPADLVEDYNPVGGPDVLVPAALPGKSAIPAGSVASTPLVFPVGPFSGEDSFFFTKSGLYSLFVEATIVFTGSGTVTFNNHLTTAVPEPATIAAALTGLPFLGGMIWRRRKTAKVIA